MLPTLINQYLIPFDGSGWEEVIQSNLINVRKYGLNECEILHTEFWEVWSARIDELIHVMGFNDFEKLPFFPMDFNPIDFVLNFHFL